MVKGTIPVKYEHYSFDTSNHLLCKFKNSGESH